MKRSDFLALLLLIIASVYVQHVGAQIGDWPNEFITWDIKDCPQFPQYDYWERNCLIHTAEPYGEIRIPQGGVDGLNLEQPMWISIPENRPTWAIAIAHAWNLHRNFIQKYDYPKIGYYMAITGHETGMACDCDAEFMPGRKPWSTTGQGELNWPAKCGQGARSDDGCFQMEFYNAWGELNQIFPHRFPCSGFHDVISGDVFETQALALSYRNIGYSLLMEYSWNMNPWEIFENPNCDEYAYEKFLAASWNGSIAGTYKTLTQSNVPSPGGWEPDPTKQKANPVHFFENRNATANNPNWDLDGTVAYYPEVIAWSMAAIEGNTTYPGYRYDAGDYTGALISTGTGQAGELDYLGNPIPAGQTLPKNSVNGTYPELQNHVQLGYYNGDIYWTDVDYYIDRMLPFYFEFADPNLLAQVKAKVKAVFVDVAGSETAAIPFMQLGPVVDEIILSFPKENPLIAMLQLDGIPNGPSGSGQSMCTGKYAPASHIKPVNIETDTMCTKQTLILEADVVGGDEPNMTYTWYMDGNEVANGVNVNQYAFTPTVAGEHHFDLMICNQAGGCSMAACTYRISVNECSACILAAVINTENTPCRNTEGGKLILDITGSSNYTVFYDGPLSGNVEGTSSRIEIGDLLDGIYNVRIQDNDDPDCFYLSSEEIDYDFYMNDVVEAFVVEQRDCETEITADIVKDDCKCDYTVYAKSIVPNRWERYATMKISPSNGRFEIFRANTFDNNDEPLSRKFQLCSGETLRGEFHLIPASGSCDDRRTDAVNIQREAYEVWVVDPEGTEVYRETIAAGTATQDLDYLMFDITIDCPYSSPFDYSYVWNPSAKTTQSIVEQKGYTDEVMYTVVATNIQHPQCVIRDSVLVPFDCSTGCTAPGQVILSPEGETIICDDTQRLTVSASTSAPLGGFNYEFFFDGGTGFQSLGIASTNDTYIATVSGDYYVIVSDPSNPTLCFEQSNTVTITIDDAPSPAQVGVDRTICNDRLTLTAIAPAVGIGVWSVVSGNATIDDPTSTSAMGFGLGEGENTFRWTVSSGSCLPQSAEVTITRDFEPSDAVVGADQILCSEMASLSADPVSVGTGTWSLVSGAGIISGSNVSSLGIGENVFEWTVTNGVCQEKTAQLTITRDEAPSIAEAGEDQSLCVDMTSLEAVTPTIGSGEWSLVSGNASIEEFSNPSSVLTGIVGNVVLEWTVGNGVCPSSSDLVSIQGGQEATATVQIDADQEMPVCEGTALTLMASMANEGTAPQLEWLLNGQTQTEASSRFSISNPNNDDVVQVRLTSNLDCVVDAIVISNEVTLDVDQLPSLANAGEDQEVCAALANLSAEQPATGQGVWSVVSGLGTVEEPSNPLSSISGLEDGVTVLQWEVTSGVCQSTFDQITITKSGELSIPDAGVDQRVCGSSVTLNAIPPTIGTGEWSYYTAQSRTIVLSSEPSFGVNDLQIGQNVFVWTVSNSVCPSVSDQVIITRDEVPDQAVAGGDQELCTDQVQLQANIPRVGQGEWTVISGSGTFSDVNLASAVVSGLQDGINVFEWRISNGVCSSSASQVEMTKSGDLTVPETGRDTALCESVTDYTLSANDVRTGETGFWTVLNGSVEIADSYDPNTRISNMSFGENRLAWTIDNGVCDAISDEVVITIDQLPDNADAGSDQSICDRIAELQANAPQVGVGLWTVNEGEGQVSDENDPKSQLQMRAEQSTLEWTISTNNACLENTDEVVITSTGVVATSVILNINDDLICVGEVVTINADVINGGNSPTYKWSIGGEQMSETTSSIQITPDQTSEIAVQVTSSLPCAVPNLDGDIGTVEVVEYPSPMILQGDIQMCESENRTILALGEGELLWYKNGELIQKGESLALGEDATGTWYVSEDNGVCPAMNSESIDVKVYEQPKVNAGQDIVVYLEQSRAIEGSVSIGDVSWSPTTYLNSTDEQPEVLAPDETGSIEYTLTATNGPCLVSDVVEVTFEAPFKIPNAFSPNGDGVNDIWVIEGLDEFEATHLVVFNRWGNKIYETYGREPWDGTNWGKTLPVGTYYFILDVEDDSYHGGITITK